MTKIVHSNRLSETLERIRKERKIGEQAKILEERLSATLTPALNEALEELQNNIQCNVELHYDIGDIPSYIEIFPQGTKLGAIREIRLPEGAQNVRIEERNLRNLKDEVKCLVFDYNDFNFSIYCI